MFSKLFTPRTLTVAILLFALAAVTFGFAAANIVGATQAGDGVGVVSGYTVTVTWTLDAVNPDEMDSATLTFAAGTPGTVYASIDGGTSWISCTAGSPSTCTFAAATMVSGIVSIQVVAAD